MKLILKSKGPGRGWWGPPKGTHAARTEEGKTGERRSKAPTDKLNQTDPRAYGHLETTTANGERIGWDSDQAQEGAHRGVVKERISNSLAERVTGTTFAEIEDIADDDAYEKASNRYANVKNDFTEMQQVWAGSSNDHDARALSMQTAAAQEFGVPVSVFVGDRLNATAGMKVRTIDDLVRRGMTREAAEAEMKVMSPSWYPLQSRSGMTTREKLRAVYDHTQEQLRADGIAAGSYVRLYRGVTLPNNVIGDMKVLDYRTIRGNPLESWSVSKEIASGFASMAGAGTKGVVFEALIPVENIVSTARTGMGCLSEGEFIVLGSNAGHARVADLFVGRERW